MLKSILTIILLLQAATLHALISSNTVRRNIILYSVANNDHNNEDFEEMRELIFSLSKEPTDEDRRTRVQEVFQEALARPNGGPKQFSDLFDTVLTKVGEDVQMEAKKKFLREQESSTEEIDNSADEATTKNTVAEAETERVKTPEELQLWALVDMMVQSKTIVKQANGDLGSKGNFQ